MNTNYILIDKKPVAEPDLIKWEQWFETHDRHVANTFVEGKDRIQIEISTVFLGINDAFGGGEPILFETMVFGGPLDMEQNRYHTWEEAEKGHAEMVDRVLDSWVLTLKAGFKLLRRRPKK